MAPAAAKLAPEQLEQPAAFTVPAPVTEPENPGAQMVHAATDVLPVAEPVVYVPTGQAVQLAAPAAEKKPGLQAVQAAPSAYVPAMHGTQEGCAPEAENAQLPSSDCLLSVAPVPPAPGAQRKT